MLYLTFSIRYVNPDFLYQVLIRSTQYTKLKKNSPQNTGYIKSLNKTYTKTFYTGRENARRKNALIPDLDGSRRQPKTNATGLISTMMTPLKVRILKRIRVSAY